ncbi:hypothetical protein EVC27_093 [Rhizobium phage RHph_I1_6]|uniref:Uncharacterized protein n=1 Tax=Rhizobium phage RHph_I1_6 TaxID=2509728 RepID=A0A7S5RJS2_9CAUD|nr:hypothetical protein PP745_gp098 [Rhizobium phage RHph_I1_6]QIG76615.1 hypothetical protein EVC27_093 [Rhizobium phage RHph_I1_6]
MIRKHTFFVIAAGVALLSLASCGTVDVASERPRSITAEKESQQLHERGNRQRAEAAAKEAEAVSKGWKK